MAGLGQALAAGRHGDRDELMASMAAYSGLRWGELTALTVPQIDQAGRIITVDRKVVEVAGNLYVDARKNPRTATIYPRRTPAGYRSRSGSPLASSRRAPSSRRHEPARADLPLPGLRCRYGAKLPKAAAKITDDLDQLLASTTTRPSTGCTCARLTRSSRPSPLSGTVKVTKGPGSRAAGLAMASKLIQAAQDHGDRSMYPTWSPWSAPEPSSATVS